ncbi:MAG: SDR family oxidoreductase [Lentisphaeria bacterium]|nr:SDR family oxidoreductase [Lentisphaeria bacterium]NRB62789.1 SDR family oxidoreductase [Saprospiraceae bacterium]
MEILAHKNVLIIGATGGIGREAAKLLKQSQVNLFLTSRKPDELNQLGTSLDVPSDQLFRLDVTQSADVNKVAEAIHQKVEKIDILINASGIGIIKPIEKLTDEDFDHSVDVNLKGTFYLLRAFLPGMKAAKKGLIINLPGVLGKTPMAGAAAYAATKYGVNGLTKSVREELRRTQVRITNLYLGGTDTAFWDDIEMKVNRDKFVTAKEAGRAVWFLCQQPSSGVVSEMVLQPFNHQAI